MTMQFSAASISIIAENGEETPIGIASVRNLDMSDRGEPAMIPNSGEKFIGQTFAFRLKEPEKLRSKLLGIILLHHRRN